jgi:acetylornithine deacetylase/succinyl-diaminopimelate desuccinylase-like protein
MKKKVSAFILIILLVSSVFGLDGTVKSVREYRRANERQMLEDFIKLLSLPNVASDRENIRRNADHLVGLMTQRGLKPQLLEAADKNAPPAVYGEWLVPNAKQTIVFYAHYDGQPTNPRAWTGSEPWTPVLRDRSLEKGGQTIPFPQPGAKIDPEWRVYARSASDDKAGVFAILKAFDALRASKIQPSVNLKFFFEGEEEAGSDHLGEILTRHKDLLKSDAWIICDGPVHQSGRKQVVFGVRGVTVIDLTTYGAIRPLHSGHYGNWSPNPALLLAQLLSSMKDENGRVLIKNWNDDTEPLGQQEMQAMKDAPQYDAELKEQLGLVRTDNPGKSYLESLTMPSLNLDGFASGDVGALARNVIPSTANAVLDIRLVKGNDHRRQVEKVRAHLREKGYHVIDRDPTPEERQKYPLIVKFIHQSGGYNAQRTPMDLSLSLAVVKAVEAASEQPVVKLPTLGGSLPLSIITESLNVPTITVPIANYDNNQHAENENIRLQNLWDGIEIFAKLMTL